MLSLIRLVLLSIFVVSGAARAESIPLERRFGIGGYGGGALPTGAELFRDHTDMGWAAGAFATYFISNEISVDFTWDHLQFMPTVGSTTTEAFSGNLNWRMLGAEAFSPTIGIGAGYGMTSSTQLVTNLLLSPYNFSGGLFNVKASLDYLVSDTIMIGLGAKHIWLFNNNGAPSDRAFDINALVPNLSITLFFKPRSKESAEELPAPAAIHEPLPEIGPEPTPEEPAPEATPEPTPEATPEPTPEPVATPAPTPEPTPEPAPRPAPVAKNPLETRCKNVPPGTKVNSLGCPVSKKIEIRLNVEFPFGKTTISKKYESEFKKIAKFLKGHSDFKLTIHGHADDIGPDQENLKLSKDRAIAIRKHLIRKYGIASSRIRAVGHGERKPIASNKSPKGRQKNRRAIGVFISSN